MTALTEFRLVLFHELRRNLRSRKGIAMFLLFLLGGSVPTIAQVVLEQAKRAAGFDRVPAAAQRSAIEQGLKMMYRGDAAIARYLADCPPALFFLFQGTLVVLPLLVLLIGFDQLAGEVQHRSVRYLVGRASRASIVVGKAVAVLLVAAIMISVLHAVVTIFFLVRADYSTEVVLTWSARVWAFSVAYAMPFAGLVSLISACFRTPVLALFAGAGLLFVVWLLRLLALSLGEAAAPLTWVFPATYEHLMVSPEPLVSAFGCSLALLWGGAAIAIATQVFRMRDV